MANFDLTNLAVKMICPNNVVKTDDTDLPSVLVYIPKFKNSDVLTGGNDSTHPAFIVNGVEIPGFYYGKYQAKVYNSVAYSLPGEDPTARINFDTARARCEAKGAGWHLSTNAEWAAIALWCKKNGFLPYGNNNYGKDSRESNYKAVPSYYESGKIARVATGTGPISWSHDKTMAGIWDLNGNVWEWQGGIRLVWGELQILANNDAADPDNPQNATSTCWKEALLNYVKATGASIGDLETQLGFLWKELAESYATVLAVLKKATSVRQASDAVLLKYEQPKDQSASVQTKRASYGQTYFNKYATKTTNNTQGGKTMSNSSLVDCTVYSPNHSGKRTHSIDRLTPHCVVGQLSAETIGACFPKGRDASCNYGIGYDGRVCLIVDECNRSWCSSSNANDQRAITIECASDKAEPYAMKSAVYEKLIKLCADICKRNGKTKVLWLGSKEEALAYEPKANEIVLTAHRWFANKSCPGDWLYSRYGELADRINALLGSTDSGNSGGNNTPSGGSGVKYYVQTGAYKQKANADAQLKKVKAAGFDAILKQSGGFYKVQTGAYSKKENADAEVKKLKAKDFDAIVTTDGGNAAGSASSEIKVGDVVQFSGGPHYGSAAASTAAGSPKAGPAKVTRIVKGAKHPYHIVHTDSQSNVYGWVDAANVSK